MTADQTRFADIIFSGGDIVTVDPHQPLVEALAVTGDRITAAGSRQSVLELAGPDTKMVDLQGKTLMPGLIEPHTHPIASALLYSLIDVSGFNHPSGDAVMAQLKKAANEKKPGEWISAFGYDPILTRDLQSLNADMLDRISTEHPIFILTQTMHTAYVNHKALEIAGITRDTPQPAHGSFFVKDAGGNPTGMLIEQQAIMMVMLSMPPRTMEENLELLRLQFRQYARAGYTTICGPGLFPFFHDTFRIIEEMVNSPDCPIRLTVLHKATDMEQGLEVSPGGGNDRFKVTGVKFWYDGSPYTGNIYLEHPYLNSDLMQKGLGIPKDTCGSAVMTRESLLALVQKYHDMGWQISIHGQGDRAIRDIIEVYDTVLKKSPRPDHRHRLEHGALFPADLLESAARLGIAPSWHINHIYYYGEALEDEMLGPERTKSLMPMAAANQHGLTSSLHNDSPMYPPEPFKLMRTAVTRQTRLGRVIGAEQGITVEDAVRAVTIDAAWQLFMEDRLGSLEAGKLADLVILSKNPLKTDPAALDKIEVIETWLGGRRV